MSLMLWLRCPPSRRRRVRAAWRAARRAARGRLGAARPRPRPLREVAAGRPAASSRRRARSRSGSPRTSSRSSASSRCSTPAGERVDLQDTPRCARASRGAGRLGAAAPGRHLHGGLAGPLGGGRPRHARACSRWWSAPAASISLDGRGRPTCPTRSTCWHAGSATSGRWRWRAGSSSGSLVAGAGPGQARQSMASRAGVRASAAALRTDRLRRRRRQRCCSGCWCRPPTPPNVGVWQAIG